MTLCPHVCGLQIHAAFSWQEPVQEWGEEHENGAVFGITLRREPVQLSADPTEAFVQYRTCKVRRLKAATLDKLVSHLLDPCCQEQDYGRILLSTYRTFTNSVCIYLYLLIYFPHSSLWTVLQMWLEEYSDDLRDAPMHSSLRLMCLQLRGHPALFLLAKRGPVDHLEESALNKEERDFESDNLMDFLSFSITDVAEQLTRMDADLFMKVVPFQCLGCVWSQRDKKENLSPTIWATIAQFNAVTNWVITSLLRSSSSATQRAKIIEKWVRIAQGCRELKNFSSLKAILSALQSNPIYRLRKTWAALSREAMSVFENLCETFPDENCVLTSREIFVDVSRQHISWSDFLQRSAGGTVPYLGTYLTVLTMLDTALPDTVEVRLESCLFRNDGLLAFISDAHTITFPSLSKHLALSSCSQNTEAFPSSSSPDSSTVSSSSFSSQQDLNLNPSSSSSSSSASADPHLVSSHKRSVSMTSLPFYNRQVDDSCIIRVSVEFCNNGNMYKSILLTSQDKMAQVIQRALQKHNLEDVSEQDFTLVQVLAQGRELHIPEKANVYYAMSTSANYDFVLRKKDIFLAYISPWELMKTLRRHLQAVCLSNMH
uniref:Ral guanine nucleotide dissociation stimulator-like 1 n=1 Tax=Sinocyclocheilus grahami TaxID=75366 RepID=A0A672PZB4_SINGR